MKLREEYTAEAEMDNPMNKDKRVISDDAFAIVDLIDVLTNKIEHTRLSLIR